MVVAAVWDFRANKDHFTKRNMIKFLTKYCKKWCFQLEQTLNGYTHWQGRLSLTKKNNKKFIVEMMAKFDITEPNYMEPTAEEKHRKGSMFYVMKEESRIEGPFTDANWQNDINDNDIDFDSKFNDPNVFVPYTLDNIRYDNLFPFQKYICQSSLKCNRDPRKIDLIIDDGYGRLNSKGGNIGKSTVASYLRIGGHAIDMPACNDFDRLVFTLCDILQGRHNHDPKIILFDLPRALTKNKLHGFICAFEQIKKGYLYDTRNKYSDWEIHPPRIWVFCNEMIDLSLLSSDRWNLWFVDDNKELFALTNLDSSNNLNSLDEIVEFDHSTNN